MLWRLKLMSLVCASMFMLLVAARLDIGQMYLMAAILLAIPLVSYLIGKYALKEVRVRRFGPETAVEGEPFLVEFELQHRAELLRDLLTAQDVTADWMVQEAVVPDPERPGHIRATMRVDRRGHYILSAVELTATDPLGLFVYHRRAHQETEFLIYPRPMALPETLLGREARSGRESRSLLTRRGASLEMHSTREYQPGDELRHIHWPSTARTGKLVVVERAEPTDRTTWIALDLLAGSERGVAPQTSLDVAARLAAAAAHDALAKGEAVGLFLPDMETSTVPPGRGTDHYYTLLGALAKAQATGRVPLGQTLLQEFASASGRLILFTAVPDPGLAEAIGSWIHAGGSVTGVIFSLPLPPTEPETALQEGFMENAERQGAVIRRLVLDVTPAAPLDEEFGADG